MYSRIFVATLLCMLMVGAARGQEREAFGLLQGSVITLQRSALPPQAVLRVRLEDVSRVGAPASLLTEVEFPTRGKQVPLPFCVPYLQADIAAGRRYGLRATIFLQDRPLFTSTQAIPVRADGTDDAIQIRVNLVVSVQTATLEGTHWKLIQLGPKAVVPGGRNEPHIVLHAEGRKLTGSGGINSLFGTYTRTGNGLRLGPVGATRMAGPEPLMRQENAFVKALEETTGYRIVGDVLELRKGTQALARFKAQPVR